MMTPADTDRRVAVSPLINTKRLRGKRLSVLRQEIMKRTTMMCRCKFDSSNMKHMRDFPQDKGTDIFIFSDDMKHSGLSIVYSASC